MISSVALRRYHKRAGTFNLFLEIEKEDKAGFKNIAGWKSTLFRKAFLNKLSYLNIPEFIY